MDENNNLNKELTNISTNDTNTSDNTTITQSVPFRSAFSMDDAVSRSGFSDANASYTMNQDSFSTNYYAYQEPPEEPSNGYAIASLILGILSIPGGCCCGLGILFSLLGIILGCVQPRDLQGRKPGMAIAGIVLSIFGILVSICSIIYYIFGGFILSEII